MNRWESTSIGVYLLQETRIYEIIRIRRIPNVRGNHDYNFGRTKVEECENNKEDLLKEMITVRES